MRRPFFRSCAISCLFCILAAGCRERSVTSYRIPKETDPEMPGAADATPPTAHVQSTNPSATSGPMANTAVPTAGGAGLVWIAPSQWISKPATAMRKATYSISGDNGETADLSITAFPGDVGGELANINRWRGQIQLAPLSSSDLATAVTRVESNGLHFAVVDFTGAGAKPQRVLGAQVPVDGATWFFKLSGPAALVAREQAAFNSFLKTVRPPATP